MQFMHLKYISNVKKIMNICYESLAAKYYSYWWLLLSITRTGGWWMLQALHQTVAAVGWGVARAGRLPRPSLCELALSLSLQFFTFT